ncbi:MAG TPA: class I SAM-dependent methyltransferase [Thermoleophilia bacterium]|nr:class I SAM-dependent methyltransferase [Thermoleophilia bacterium]
MSGALSPREAACVYDRIGRLQDWQSLYEGPAIDELLGAGDFAKARSMYELGPGTGALAERLLLDHLPADARYRGVDVSPKMVRLSRERLHRWADRARIDLVDGSLPLPGRDGEYDRFLAAYVFDLLAPDYSVRVLEEARRLLGGAGLLCLVSLTTVSSGAGRLVSAGWRRLWQLDARIVGGCRPVDLVPMLMANGWEIQYRGVLQAWSISSEIVVAAPRPVEGH